MLPNTGMHPANFKGGWGSKKNSIPHSRADPEKLGGEGIKFYIRSSVNDIERR